MVMARPCRGTESTTCRATCLFSSAGLRPALAVTDRQFFFVIMGDLVPELAFLPCCNLTAGTLAATRVKFPRIVVEMS